jgi:hypothetical protein
MDKEGIEKCEKARNLFHCTYTLILVFFCDALRRRTLERIIHIASMSEMIFCSFSSETYRLLNVPYNFLDYHINLLRLSHILLGC